jgi:hypothetical protein
MLESVSNMANLFPTTAAANQTGITLPFVTVPFFERFGMAARQLSNISSIVYSPVIFNDSEREAWVPYSVENQGWISDSYSYYPAGEYDSPPQSIRTDLWDSRGVVPDRTGPYLPAWQMTPPPAEPRYVVNFNYASLAGFYRMMQQVINSQAPLLSEPANFSSIAAFGAETSSFDLGNTSILLVPVLDTLEQNAQASVVGIMLAVIPWVALFAGVLPTGQNGVIVVAESCGSNTSYQLNGPVASVLGWGDWHDPKYSSLAYQSTLLSSFGNYTSSSGLDSRPDFYSCNHVFYVFPTAATVSSLSASTAAAVNPNSGSSSYGAENIDVILTAVVASVFAFSALVFLCYDRLLRRSKSDNKQAADDRKSRLDDDGEQVDDPEISRDAPPPGSISEDEDLPQEEEEVVEEDAASDGREGKILALVQYNSETLVDLLRQIVSSRKLSRKQSLVRESPRRTSQLQASLDAVGVNIGNGGLVVDEALDVIEFPNFMSQAEKTAAKAPRKGPRESLTPLDPEVVDQVYMFVAIVAGLYRDENAFHNFEHSSQVALTLCKMLAQAESNLPRPSDATKSKRSRSRASKSGATASSKSLLRKSSTGSVDSDDDVDARANRGSRRSSNDSMDSDDVAFGDADAGMDMDGRSDDSTVPARDSTSYFSYIVGDPLVKFAVVLSALVHDVDHRGVPNDVLHSEEPTLSAAYRRRSVHEQNALEMCWSALFSEGLEELRSALFADVDDLQLFRQVLVNCVMATDLFDSNLRASREERFRRAFRGRPEGGLPPDEGEDGATTRHLRRQATVAMEIMMQAADVAPTIQPWFLYTKWNERLYREAHDAYRSRRTFRDPSETWYHDEIEFFDSYSLPIATKLKECGVLGAARSEDYLQYAEENRRQWVATGRDIVARYVETYNNTGEGGGGISTSRRDGGAGDDRSAPVGILRSGERRPSSKRPGGNGEDEDARSKQKSVRINEA